MRVSRVLLAAILLCGGIGAACKKKDEQPPATEIKIDRKIERKKRRKELPAKYKERAKPDFQAGEAFHIYLDGELLAKVKSSEFSCKEPLFLLLGGKAQPVCALVPFALSKAQGKGEIRWVELAGEPGGYRRLDLPLAADAPAAIIGFATTQNMIRADERPRDQFLSAEDAKKDPKELLRQRQAEKAKMKRDRNSERFRAGALLWVDLHTVEPPPETASKEAGEEAEGGQQEPAEALALVLPGGKSQQITSESLAGCDRKGCSLSDFLPKDFKGTWCVTTPEGVEKIPAAALAERTIKGRRRGGFVIPPGPRKPGEKSSPIRGPSKIEPCP